MKIIFRFPGKQDVIPFVAMQLEENFALKQNYGETVYRETVHGGYEIQTESSRPDGNLDYYYHDFQDPSVVVM